VHVHVGVIGSHGDLLEELVDQDASFDLCRDLPRLVDVDGPQHPRDGVEVLCDVVGARRLHPCAARPALLKHFLLKALEVARSVGVRILVVHDRDDEAKDFFMHYGFVESSLDPPTVMMVLGDDRRAGV